MVAGEVEAMRRGMVQSTGFLPESWTWERIALWLVCSTLAYNVGEAGVALWFGAEAGSVALVGFGLDSLIEMSAATVLLWRLSLEAKGVDRERIERTERGVHRFIGGTFVVLALYVSVQSIWTIWKREAPAESLVGIILAALSLVIMPLVSFGKLHAAKQIGSAALRAEAKETLACSYLSFTLLIGLAANSAFGWWWADPAAALLMVPWLVKEGREGLAGDGHCCS